MKRDEIITGQEAQVKRQEEWSRVVQWSPEIRYHNPALASEADARALLAAARTLVEKLCNIIFVKIEALLDDIEAEQGPFDVKCLAARDPDDLLWTLILSADWFTTFSGDLTAYLVKHTLKELDDESLSDMLAVIPYLPGSGGDLLETVKGIQVPYAQERYGTGMEREFFVIDTPHPLARRVVPLKPHPGDGLWRFSAEGRDRWL